MAARARRKPLPVHWVAAGPHWVAAGRPVSRADVIAAVEAGELVPEAAQLRVLRVLLEQLILVLDTMPEAAREATIRYLMATYGIGDGMTPDDKGVTP